MLILGERTPFSRWPVENLSNHKENRFGWGWGVGAEKIERRVYTGPGSVTTNKRAKGSQECFEWDKRGLLRCERCDKKSSPNIFRNLNQLRRRLESSEFFFGWCCGGGAGWNKIRCQPSLFWVGRQWLDGVPAPTRGSVAAQQISRKMGWHKVCNGSENIPAKYFIDLPNLFKYYSVV